MKKSLLAGVLSVLALSIQAAPKIMLSNSTSQSYQLVWYISIPQSHEVIAYQQTVPANSAQIPAVAGTVYTNANMSSTDSTVSVMAAAYATGSPSQFADNSLAVKLSQGDQVINNDSFALSFAIRDSGIAVFIQQL